MFSFLLQLPRLLASMVSSAAENIQQTVTHVVTTVAAVGLFTASVQTNGSNGSMAKENTTKAKATTTQATPASVAQAPETKANVASFSRERARIMGENTPQNAMVHPVANTPQTKGEVQHLSSDSVTFDVSSNIEKDNFTPPQRKLTELVDYARQSDIGRNLMEQAAKHNVDLVFDYNTDLNAYYNSEEGQIALNGRYEKTTDKAEMAEAVLCLYEELGHVKHNTKDSLFVHDYLNKAEKPVEVQYFSPEGYFHVRRNEEATAKVTACMAMDEWGHTAEGKAFVDAYVQTKTADKSDYMAQAFNAYREELSGRLDVPSRLLAASNTYLELMTNADFTDTYDHLVFQMDSHDIWTHAANATFVEPTHEILQQAGKVTIGNQEYNVLSNYVDLTEAVFRQYSQSAVDCIQKKSQELQVSAPEFALSDVSADGQTPYFMPSSTMDFMMRDVGLHVGSSDSLSMRDEMKNATVRANLPVIPAGAGGQNSVSVSPVPVLEHD